MEHSGVSRRRATNTGNLGVKNVFVFLFFKGDQEKYPLAYSWPLKNNVEMNNQSAIKLVFKQSVFL